MDHFEVFGLPRRLVIDEADLQRRFYELSRRHHPDFHQGAPRDEQARSLETSARINAAYRTLRDPIRRVEYLVRLEGGAAPANSGDVKPKAPPGLLAEMFEIQEALQEAKRGELHDAGRAALQEQRARLEIRYEEEGARLRGPLSKAWDGATSAGRPRVLGACAESLAARAYLGTVIDDLAQALGEGQEPHVTHHRH
jgi:molecular chaperone HscB